MEMAAVKQQPSAAGTGPVPIKKLAGPSTTVRLASHPDGAFHPYVKPPTGNPVNLESRHSAPLRRLTAQINDTYRTCNPGFRYLSSLNPRRVLTKPAQGVHNQNYDNTNFDLILYVNDILGLQTKNRYVVLDLLGQGTFGQVVKCRKQDSGEIVAVKVVKNRPAYYNQGMFEVHILQALNSRYNGDQHNIVQMMDFFMDRGHLCLVFELLSVNLFELIAQNQYKGLSTNLIRIFLRQILKALVVLEECGIIHCDLKPENILLRNTTTPHIKLIDFGSACYAHQTVYTYIQSRFYRSPEVLIGHPYTTSIDMWSLGCMAAELFLGIPLFPGHNEYNQLARIVEMQGDISPSLLERGKFTSKFYNVVPLPGERFHFEMKSKEQWAEENNTKPRPTKRYFPADKRLGEIIQAYPCKKGITPQALESEKRARVAFVDFIEGLLRIDPSERWTADQASHHPFVTGQPFTGPWTPPPRKPVAAPSLPVPPFHLSGRGPAAAASTSSAPPPLSSSLPPVGLLVAAQRPRPGQLPASTAMGPPGPPAGLAHNLALAEKNSALGGRRGSLPTASHVDPMNGGMAVMGGYQPLPQGYVPQYGPPPPSSSQGGIIPGGNGRAINGGSGGPPPPPQQQRPRGGQQQQQQPLQQPQYPSPPSGAGQVQWSPRSMPNSATTGGYGGQAPHGGRGGPVPGAGRPPMAYADLIPLASATLSTSPTAVATATATSSSTSSSALSPSMRSSPPRPSASAAATSEAAVAYYYDSSTYPPPQGGGDHGHAGGSRARPSLGPFQKQIDARNQQQQHRRRSVSMEPKQRGAGLSKQRTQTAAAISAAAGEISAGSWDRLGGGDGAGKGGKAGGKGGSQRIPSAGGKGGGGAGSSNDNKHGGTRRGGHTLQRAGSADGDESPRSNGGLGRGSGRRQRSTSNMESSGGAGDANGAHEAQTTGGESPVGSPTAEMERLSLADQDDDATTTTSTSSSSSFSSSNTFSSATRSPKNQSRQHTSSSSSSTPPSSSVPGSSSSSSAFLSTTSLAASPDARKRSPRSPRKQLPFSKLGGGSGQNGSSLPSANGSSPSSSSASSTFFSSPSSSSSSSSVSSSSASSSSRSRPPVSPRTKQQPTTTTQQGGGKGKGSGVRERSPRDVSPPRGGNGQGFGRAVIPPSHHHHQSAADDDGWDSRATEDLMFDEGSPYARSPPGVKSPPGLAVEAGLTSPTTTTTNGHQSSNPISIGSFGGGAKGGRGGSYASSASHPFAPSYGHPGEASWSEYVAMQPPKFSPGSSWGAGGGGGGGGGMGVPTTPTKGQASSDGSAAHIFGFSPSSMPSSQGFFYAAAAQGGPFAPPPPAPPHPGSFQPPGMMDPRFGPPIVGTPLMGMVHSSFEVGTPGRGSLPGAAVAEEWATHYAHQQHHQQQQLPLHHQQHQQQQQQQLYHLHQQQQAQQQAYSSPYSAARHPPALSASAPGNAAGYLHLHAAATMVRPPPEAAAAKET